MGGFVYYFPKCRLANAAVVKARGLLDVLGTTKIESREVHAGPDKGSGCVVARHGNNGSVQYSPESQTWVGVHDADYWIGFDTDTPPSPNDLARDSIISGHFVTLEDGNSWLVPAARIFPDGSALPQRLMLGPNGELVSTVLPRFAAISRDAERVWESLRAGLVSPSDGKSSSEKDDLKSTEDVEPLLVTEAWTIAIAALGINYRVGQAEISALGVITTANLKHILEAFVDLPTLLSAAKEFAKKNACPSESDSSSGGDSDCCETTTQP